MSHSTLSACSTCSTPMVWITTSSGPRTVCPKPACPDRSLSAASSAQGAPPVAVGVVATGDPRPSNPTEPGPRALGGISRAQRAEDPGGYREKIERCERTPRQSPARASGA
jgi:hypothetical protein